MTALAIGIATATFAIGFQDNLEKFLTNDRVSFAYGQDVIVSRYPGIADEKLAARLAQLPQARQVIAVKILTMRVPGRKDPTPLYAMRGDNNASGYRAVRGRWFERSGEAVVSVSVAKDAHVQIGQSFDGSLVGGQPIKLRVVGFFNDFSAAGGTARTGWDTLTAATPGVTPDHYLVQLAPGTDAGAYAREVAALAPDALDTHVTHIDEVNSYTNLLTLMVAMFAVVLLVIAAAGVFNATLLTARERVRDISVLKALGLTARQIGLMAVGSTVALAALAAVVGLPLGIWLAATALDRILSVFGVVLPTYGPAPLPLLLALVVAFVMALLGSALPARWAAGTPVAQILRAE